MTKKRRRKRLTEDQRNQIRALRNEGLSLGEIASKFHVSRGYVSQLTSPTGGAPTAAYERWFEKAMENGPENCAVIDQARREALKLMRERMELEDYLKARAELDRLIAKIPPDEVRYGGGRQWTSWIPKAILKFAGRDVSGPQWRE